MKRATITQAKNHLSALLAEVRTGESIVIMDRGVPIARLESMATTGGDPQGRLARLQRTGAARLAQHEPRVDLILAAMPESRTGPGATQALIEERREGR